MEQEQVGDLERQVKDIWWHVGDLLGRVRGVQGWVRRPSVLKPGALICVVFQCAA